MNPLTQIWLMWCLAMVPYTEMMEPWFPDYYKEEE